MGNAVSPVVDLQKDGEEYVLNSVSTFKNIALKFQPGVEFDQDTPDGRKVKATVTIDGNTLVEVQKNADGSQTVINRTFSDDEVKMVCTNIKINLMFLNILPTSKYDHVFYLHLIRLRCLEFFL